MNESLPGDNRTNSPASTSRALWRETRRQRREARRMARSGRSYGGAWVGGAILIALGALLLLENLGSFSLGEWWALLILLPAAGAFAGAWRAFQEAGGHITPRATTAFMGGVLLVLLTASVFFQLDWGWAGPALLILAGLGFLAGALFTGQRT